MPLLLHCGAHKVELSEVLSAPLPVGTETHTPVEHRFVIDTVSELLKDYGFDIKETAHSLSHEGMRYFGLMQVVAQNAITNQEFAQVVGIRNSNDKKFPVGLTMGSQVFVCDNLAFSGEITLKRKHTSGIFGDIVKKMVDTMSKLQGFFLNQERRFEIYKGFAVTDEKASKIILDAHKHGALPKTKIVDVWTEYLEPSHTEFSERNIWSLYNAFTEIHKRTPNLNELPQRTMRMQNLFDSIVNFESQFKEMEEQTITV